MGQWMPGYVTGLCEPSRFACRALRIVVRRVRAENGAITALTNDSWWQ
jgi:hypothetical protein